MNGPQRPAGHARITYLGHATVLIELDGMRVLTDPVLRSRVGPLRRGIPRPHAGHLEGLDAIVISHLHLDHYDPASLELLAKETTVVVPPGVARSLRRSGFGDVRELEVGAGVRLGPLRLTATPARHKGNRHPLARETPSVGYIVSGSRAVYFAGDTAVFPGMASLWEDLDVALLPIAGPGPRLPEGEHMGPVQAVKAMHLLRPRLVIPIHWGTYYVPGLSALRSEVHRDAPYAFVREAAVLAPQVRTVLLQPGESLEVEAPPPGHRPA